MNRRWIIAGVLVTIILMAGVFAFRLPPPPYEGDAGDYHLGAIHLLSQGFYSLDGIRPAVEREPGQSVFLAFAYLLLGFDHPSRVLMLQAFLTFAASLAFCIQLGRIVGSRAAGITFLLLLTSGSILHATISLTRESITLSMLLFLSAAYLADGHRRRWWLSISIGLLFGAVILTYYPFVYFPILFAILWLWDGRGFIRLVAVLTCAMIIVGAWGWRNQRAGAGFRVIGEGRVNVMWYVRGEQAERVSGREPLLCLWSEYISRNWDGRSDACSFNGLMHRRWPEGTAADSITNLQSAGSSGKEKILRHPFSYLWFSAVEVLELHIPYLGGGVSNAFNRYIALMAAVQYGGICIAYRSFRNRRLALLVLLPIYVIAAFSLTDATPRYLVPVLFCYCAFAGIGYDRLLSYRRSS